MPNWFSWFRALAHRDRALRRKNSRYAGRGLTA